MANKVLTILGKEKVLKARAGAIALPAITQMAFGTGGTSNGAIIQPSKNDTALLNEVLRKNIDGFEIISQEKIRYNATITKDELVGEALNEVALIDAENDVIFIQRFHDRGKDSDVEMTFVIDDMYSEVL